MRTPDTITRGAGKIRRFAYNHFFRYILAIFPRLQYSEYGTPQTGESGLLFGFRGWATPFGTSVICWTLKTAILKVATAAGIGATGQNLSVGINTNDGVAFQAQIIAGAGLGTGLDIGHKNTP